MINSVSQSPAFGKALYSIRVGKDVPSEKVFEKLQEVVGEGVKIVKNPNMYAPLEDSFQFAGQSKFAAGEADKVYYNLLTKSDNVDNGLIKSLAEKFNDWVFVTKIK